MKDRTPRVAYCHRNVTKEKANERGPERAGWGGGGWHTKSIRGLDMVAVHCLL